MRTLVVIPTYQEVENVPVLLPAILGVSPEISIVVVDDASPDGTAEAASRIAASSHGRVALLRRPRRGGHGSAWREGLVHGLRAGDHEAFVVMDADLSHDPGAIPRLVDALRSADLAVGSRYVPGGSVSGWGWHRRLLSRTANAVARALLGLPVNDCTSGFMAFRRSALLAIPLGSARAEGYAAPVEMKWLCARAGLATVEVPIVFRDRERGSSKLDATHVLSAARGLWRISAERRSGPAVRSPSAPAPGRLPEP